MLAGTHLRAAARGAGGVGRHGERMLEGVGQAEAGYMSSAVDLCSRKRSLQCAGQRVAVYHRPSPQAVSGGFREREFKINP